MSGVVWDQFWSSAIGNEEGRKWNRERKKEMDEKREEKKLFFQNLSPLNSH